MTFRSPDSQTPSVSCDIVGSRRRFVCLCVTVCVCVCVCVCLCVCVCASLYAWRGSDGEKEVWTKKGGSIIGFSTARRHNDMAIDSGMSSRERWTNGGAGVCFSQPLIGWPREAVGLQVAKWTSEHICHPTASWRREGRGGEGRICDLVWRRENKTCRQHIISYILYVSSLSSLLHELSVLFLSDPDMLCVRGWLGGVCVAGVCVCVCVCVCVSVCLCVCVCVCVHFSGCHQRPHCQGSEINLFHLSLTWLYTPPLLSVSVSVSENCGLKLRFICLDWPFLNFPAVTGKKYTLLWHLKCTETGSDWLAEEC